MMILGFDILICPVCSQLYKKQVIASSNTFGAIFYSDGYTKGASLPNQPIILKCINKDCGQYLQIESLKKIASESYDREETYYPGRWESAYDVEGYKMNIEDLNEALEDSICRNIKNETNVRTNLLWSYNDLFRKDSEYVLQNRERELFINNIESLIILYQEGTSIKERMFLAELYREKGDFEHCIEILKDLKCEKPGEIILKEKIYSQSKIKNDRVFDFALIAVKKEYRCSLCNDRQILFDLEKLKDPRDYRHFICKDDNTVFNDSLKVQNPVTEYKLNKIQKLLNLKKPHERFIDNPELACPVCKSRNIVEFKPEKDKCIKCGTGNYLPIDWFKDN